MGISLKFCGATRTVTGSCMLLRVGTHSILIDCGLFQGSKTLKELNYRPFPFDPTKIDAVLQTHAHIDHAGLLPKLWKAGYRGPVHMTAATRDLLSFMLPDSGHIQEMDVANLNKRYARRQRNLVEPIYTKDDAEASLELFQAESYETWFDVTDDVRARFWNAGHILGSTSIEVEVTTRTPSPRTLRVLFSGDIGPEHKLLQPDPEAPNAFDYVVCETTYGGRKRKLIDAEARRASLAEQVQAALRDDGILLIPAFAVERTQELLFDLIQLQTSKRIPDVPIFLDSPLAVRVTEVFRKHASSLDLPHAAGAIISPTLRFAVTADESKAIDRIKSGAIVMAASGMCDAGRIRHHLKQWLWSEKCTVLLTGYQAVGTLGRLLADGARSVKIQGAEIIVQARIRQTDLYSGHADGAELLQWVRQRRPIHRAIFLVHGEESESEAFAGALAGSGLSADCIIVPVLDDEFDLLPERPTIMSRQAPRRLTPEEVGHRDWHNDLAQVSLDLREALEAAADNRARGVVLRRVRKALEAEGKDPS